MLRGRRKQQRRMLSSYSSERGDVVEMLSFSECEPQGSITDRSRATARIQEAEKVPRVS